MPLGNEFRHQPYTRHRPAVPYRLVAAPVQAFAGDTVEQPVLARFGQWLRKRGVDAVYLVHGTFTGTDALGIIREVERWIPSAGNLLRQKQKHVVDALIKDAGNYSSEFADGFADQINQQQSPAVPVRRFSWSSENLHMARANAAVQLLDELLQHARQNDGLRVMLWGHSHAGNVFAILTNLIGGSQQSRANFFSVGKPFLRWRVLGLLDNEVWRRVRRQVLGRPEFLNRIKLDVVTFGTPIRYGWETSGYETLLHFIHHRPSTQMPEYCVPFPTLRDLTEARYGDCVQQFGIAGTNLTPYVLAWRSWIAEKRFHSLLQRGIRRRGTLERLRLGQRVPAEGATLLVDYPDLDDRRSNVAFGHAVYTWPEWRAFHAQLIMEQLGGETPVDAT